MAIKTPYETFFSLTVSGQHAFPNGFGKIFFGFTYFGDDNIRAGIYQMRHTKQGIRIVQEIFYRPKVGRSDSQNNRRDLFSEAIFLWQNLNSSQREHYNSLVQRRSRLGYHYFIQKICDYILSGFGFAVFGLHRFGS